LLIGRHVIGTKNDGKKPPVARGSGWSPAPVTSVGRWRRYRATEKASQAKKLPAILVPLEIETTWGLGEIKTAKKPELQKTHNVPETVAGGKQKPTGRHVTVKNKGLIRGRKGGGLKIKSSAS